MTGSGQEGIGAKLRRMAIVGLGYLLGASLVLGLGRELARILILPPLFLTILAGTAVLGLPLALVVAWRYRTPG
jgi:hypothetical protein